MSIRQIAVAALLAALAFYLVPFASILICQHASRFGFCSGMFAPIMSLGGWFTAYTYGVAAIEIAVLAMPLGAGWAYWSWRR